MSTNQLKILHIMSGFGGGISSFIRNKADFMQNENILFDVATYDEPDENFKNSIRKTGGDIFRLINPKTNGWNAFKKSYTNILNNSDYDIIYCHINGYRVIPYYYYSRKHSKAKFYVHAHLNKPLKYLSFGEKSKLLVDQIVNRKISDQVVGCGELAIQSVFGEDTPQNSMMVIPNSVEVERFIKDKETAQDLRKVYRNKFQLNDNEIVIGHIGRLEKVKNHELTIKLAEHIKQNNLIMKILIIGEGNRESELKSLVTQKKLDKIITFTGRISPIEDFFPALDVMILPSFAEGLPTVAVEAQASGVPVVMSDSITGEVDLGFNMVEKVSIEEKIAEWIVAIKKTQTVNPPNVRIREQVIEQKNFSNENSAELYIDFLKGNIFHYTIT